MLTNLMKVKQWKNFVELVFADSQFCPPILTNLPLSDVFRIRILIQSQALYHIHSLSFFWGVLQGLCQATN